MQAEFDARCQTAENSMQLLKNATDEAAVNIGSVFLPHIAEASKSVVGMTQGFAAWAGEYPGLVEGTALLTASIMGLNLYVKGTLVLSRAWMAAKATWIALTAAQNAQMVLAAATGQKLTVMQRIATAAQWAWNAAMTANPVGLVIAGIALLVAAGYLLVKNWEKVKNFFVSLWDNPLVQLMAFMAFPIGPFIYLGVEIIRNWEAVKSWFTLLWNDPRAALEVFVNMVKNKFASLYQYVAEKWEKLKYILSNPITAAVNFVEHGNVHGSMTHESTGMSANDIRGIDENALGGIYKRPHLTWVAEAGSPEAIVPLDGSRRAFSLWQKAGEMLGAFPPADASDDSHSGEGLLQKALGLLGVGRDTAPSVNIESSVPSPITAPAFSFPPMTINLTFNGKADAEEVRAAVVDAGHRVQKDFAEQYAELMHERWRTCYD